MTDPSTTTRAADGGAATRPATAPATFVDRHIGPREGDVAAMLTALGHDSLESLMAAAVPGGIRSAAALDLPEALDEEAARRAFGVEADARAYLVLRPYVRGAVRVHVLDPDDPAPYWLVSSRRPERLAQALAAAIEAGDLPGPTDPRV